jgi:16S rRNA (uracil1498-N3)-methyltransferase
MRRLFVDPETLQSDPVVIEGADHHHLANVLRVRHGERLHVLDGAGSAREAQVVEVGRRSIRLALLGELPVPPDPPRRVLVAQALAKGDRFEEALKHATEVGAWGFAPLLTERGVRRLDADNLDAKLARWRRVLKGASEQSERAAVPALEEPGSVAEVVRRYSGEWVTFLLDPSGAAFSASLAALDPRDPVLLLIGPEGGFCEAEIEAVREAGGAIVSLGPFVLRTETAGVVATALAVHVAAAVLSVLEST